MSSLLPLSLNASGIAPLASAPFAVNPATLAVQETAELRMIKAELHEIGRQLNHSGLQDETTKLLRHWHRNFSRSVRGDGNSTRAIQEFIPLLQNLLIDPIARMVNPQSTVLLDDRPLLGNDGRTYGFKSLTLFLSAAGIHRNRSPFRQNEVPTELFTTQPHPVAAYMVDWLKKFNSYTPSPEIDEGFRQLMVEGRAASIPSSAPLVMSREERIRRLVADQAQRSRRNRVAEQESMQRVQAAQAEVAERANGAAAGFDRLEEMAQEMENQFAADRAEDAAAIAAITADAESLEAQIAILEREIQELKERIDGVRGRISTIDRQNAELERDIKEVQKALKEREKSWIEGLLITAAIVAACLTANYYLAPAITSVTSGTVVTKVLPMAYGAQVAVKVPITTK